MAEQPISVATRGSALALAQANSVIAQCRAAFPRLRFELKIVKTTGDKLQRASMAQPSAGLPKGLFTKELEIALLRHRADLAVHSLKDLPTDLPAGLALGAVTKRADARDALVCRDDSLVAPQHRDADAERVPGAPGSTAACVLGLLAPRATVATSSTRRKAQLLERRPDLKVVEIHGNVVTRLEKLAARAGFDATLLAVAGIGRLDFRICSDARLDGDAVPAGLRAFVLDPEVMLPCAGQGAIGIEIREYDERIQTICARLNHYNTCQCVVAERTVLRAMGGGCRSPVAAYAEVMDTRIRMRALSYRDGKARWAEGARSLGEGVALGEELSAALQSPEERSEQSARHSPEAPA